MANEIERKFLINKEKFNLFLKNEDFREKEIIQGYIPRENNTTVRIRIYSNQGFLTIKRKIIGISRPEYEYEIPKDEAEEMLVTLCNPKLITKTRILVIVGKHTWEVDFFKENNEGLIVAEIELGSEDESFVLPEWATVEVSDQKKYSNARLIKNPFSKWKKKDVDEYNAK